MSERMWLAEELEQARTQRDVLRVRVKELEEVIQTQNGVVVSGTLKLNEARARVAKLEAALKDIAKQKLDGEMDDDGPWGSNHDFVEGYEQCVKTARAALSESETWTDEHGVTWAPPTAWAYAQSCRVRDELRARIAKLEAAVRGSLIQNSGEGEWADVRRDGQRSQLAATIDAMETALSETVEE